MTNRIFYLLLFVLFGTASMGQNDYQRIAEDQVSKAELRKAITIAEKILLGQKSGKLYFPSEEEAIPEVVKGLTKEVQTSSYETIRGMYGDYKSMQFQEAWNMSSAQGKYAIYRFKGVYTNGTDKPEIRVVLDSSGKLAGLWVTPWQDSLQGTP